MSVYRNPLRAAQITPGRIDQGVDYSGSGPIYSPGAGQIAETLNSGWPGGTFIAEQMTDGPLAGQYVYTAEDVSPRVSVGDRVTARTVIGDLNGSMETGFASPPPELGQSLAATLGEPTDGSPTAEGARYSKFLASLGAPPGSLSGVPVGAPVGGLAVGQAGSPGILSSLTGLAVIIPVVLAAAAVGVWGIARTTGLKQKAAAVRDKANERAATVAQAALVAA